MTAAWLLCFVVLLSTTFLPESSADSEGCMMFDVDTDTDKVLPYDADGSYYRLTSHTTCNSRPVYRHECTRWFRVFDYFYIYQVELSEGEQRWVLSTSLCNTSTEEILMSADASNTHVLEDVQGPWYTNDTNDTTEITEPIECRDTSCSNFHFDYDTYYSDYKLCYGRNVYKSDEEYSDPRYMHYYISPDGWRGWVKSRTPCGGTFSNSMAVAVSYAIYPEYVVSTWEKYSSQADDPWLYDSDLKTECLEYVYEEECEVCNNLRNATICLSIFFTITLITLLVVMFTCIRHPKGKQQTSTHPETPPVTVAVSGLDLSPSEPRVNFVTSSRTAPIGATANIPEVVTPSLPPPYQLVFGKNNQ